VLDRILLIGVVGWLLWGRAGGEAFRIEWFVWAQTGAYAVATLVALVLVLQLSGPVRLSVRPTFSLVVLRQSFPYALLILLMTLYYRIDTLMLERLLPDGALQAGIYAQGFRFVEALNMLGYLFAGLLLPIFSRMLKAREDVAPLTLLAWRLLLAGSLAVAAFGAFHAGAVLDLRYSEDTATAAAPFALLLWCFVAVSTTYVFGTLLTAAGDLRLLNRMAAAGALVNIGLNLWLIPLWKAEGAAWASLITQVGTALLQVVLVLRSRRLPGVVRVVLGALVHGALLLAAAWWLGGLAWGLGAQMLAFGALALASAVATGLLDVRSIPQVQAMLQRGR
jgi:O-antigen/teichoic acid export membrane protein